MKAKAVFKKIRSIVEYILVGVIALCIAFVLFSNLSGKPAFILGRAAMWVKTESMEPTIPRQSYILVQKPSADGIKVGDVIVFHSDDPMLNGMLNTHRVTEITNGGSEFVTKGDHNVTVDAYTAKADKVVGVYRRNLPALSILGRFLSTPSGITVMSLLMLIVIMAVFMPDSIEKYRQQAEQEKQAKIDELIKAAVEQLKAESQKTNCDD